MQNLTQMNSDAVINGNYYVWICGSIGYINLITKHKKSYEFSTRVKPDRFGELTYNENFK